MLPRTAHSWSERKEPFEIRLKALHIGGTTFSKTSVNPRENLSTKKHLE